MSRYSRTPLSLSSNISITSNNISTMANAAPRRVAPGGTATLHDAAAENDDKAARALLDQRADPVARDSLGRSALFLALCHHSWDVANLLIDHAADVIEKSNVTYPTESGSTFFHKNFIDAKILRKLYEAGLKVHDVKDFQMNTPLHATDDLAYVRFLVANGADVNAQNAEGRTPLHLAFSEHRLHIAAYILAHCKPEVNVRDGWYKTPLLYAFEAYGLPEMDALILGVSSKGDEDCRQTSDTEFVSYRDEFGNVVEYNKGWIRLTFSRQTNGELLEVVGRTPPWTKRQGKQNSLRHGEEIGTKCLGTFLLSSISTGVYWPTEKQMSRADIADHEWLRNVKIDDKFLNLMGHEWSRTVKNDDKFPTLMGHEWLRTVKIDDNFLNLMGGEYCTHQWAEYCRRREAGDLTCYGNLISVFKEYFKTEDPRTMTEKLNAVQQESEAGDFIWKLWTNVKYAYTYRNAPSEDEIGNKVHRFIDTILSAISKKEPVFAGRKWLVGSAFEGTKIDDANEFDINVELVTLSSMCQVDSHSSHPTGFVRLRRRPQVELDKLDNLPVADHLFDEQGFLKTSFVNYLFKTALKRALEDESLWQEHADFKTTSNSSSTQNSKLYQKIKLSLKDPLLLGNSYEVSIDLVPTLRIQNWWPDDAIQSADDIKSEGCCFVFDQPYIKYGIPYTPAQYARISFGRAEGTLLRNSPAVVRAAYMVAKHILKWHDSSGRLLTSHVVKMAALNSISDVSDTRSSYETLTKQQLQSHVERLFLDCYKFSLQDFVPSWFMPSFHVPVWTFEKTVKQAHQFIHRTCGDYAKLYANVKGFGTSDVAMSLLMMYMLYFSVSDKKTRKDWIYPEVTLDQQPFEF